MIFAFIVLGLCTLFVIGFIILIDKNVVNENNSSLCVKCINPNICSSRHTTLCESCVYNKAEEKKEKSYYEKRN